MPVGIDELKSLRILASKIIIGGDFVFAVTGHTELMDLQGKLSIEGLEKVQNPVHAQEANLLQKRLSELELRWNDVCDGSVDKEVLNVLKPCNDSLKKLMIKYYGGIEFPKWVGDPSFLRLADVRIDGCKMCTALPQFGHLPSLKKLSIVGMDGAKGWEERSTKSGVADAMFPCLEELSIYNCPNLAVVSVEVLPSLRVLEVGTCSYSVLTSLVHASSVNTLRISCISGLTDEVWGGVMVHLGGVEVVSIWGCDEIRYLWESEGHASKFLVNLRKLLINTCPNLVRLGEKKSDEEENSVTRSNLLISVRMLSVWGCRNMEHCSCPHSIETLDIRDCDSITSFSFPIGGGHKLKSLSIDNCKKLVLENDLGRGEKKTTLLINNKTMALLDSVFISWLVNLESIDELRSFIHLTGLTIKDCENLKSFPDHELQNLSMLKRLVIRNCRGTDASFPRGIWPPKLSSLAIGMVKKPISEWGPQNFPPSLVELHLYGGSSSLEEGVSSWRELSHLLPSTLTNLGIYEFEKLESLSMGLQHLTSLQHLFIQNCPKMKDLPETKTLYSSLLSLTIMGCPNLRERCRGRSSYYWHLISHIPVSAYTRSNYI